MNGTPKRMNFQLVENLCSTCEWSLNVDLTMSVTSDDFTRQWGGDLGVNGLIDTFIIPASDPSHCCLLNTEEYEISHYHYYYYRYCTFFP